MSFGVPSGGSRAWTLDEETSRGFIRQAIDAGLRATTSRWVPLVEVYVWASLRRITVCAVCRYWAQVPILEPNTG